MHSTARAPLPCRHCIPLLLPSAVTALRCYGMQYPRHVPLVWWLGWTADENWTCGSRTASTSRPVGAPPYLRESVSTKNRISVSLYSCEHTTRPPCGAEREAHRTVQSIPVRPAHWVVMWAGAEQGPVGEESSRTREMRHIIVECVRFQLDLIGTVHIPLCRHIPVAAVCLALGSARVACHQPEVRIAIW